MEKEALELRIARHVHGVDSHGNTRLPHDHDRYLCTYCVVVFNFVEAEKLDE